jgi:phytoene dehydrogenase-like protein
MDMTKTDMSDVVVVGAGLAGLAAATYVARAGRTVVLFEKSRTLGGRAVTQIKDEFRFNLGPHALYRRGHGAQVLHELGVPFSGGVPNASGGYAVENGVKHTLPGGFVSLLTTGLLRLPGKLETARLLGSIQKINADAAQHLSVREWLDGSIRQPDVRRLVQALFRVGTYANAPDQQSAGSAIAQLQMALAGGVTYLDGGWQTLVDGLCAAAEASGVRIVSGTRVESIECDGAVHGVRLADGTRHPAGAVMSAASPQDAAVLVPSGHDGLLRRWADTAVPVKAACLDVALARLPRPRSTFALGIDHPLYLSVHSAVAKLAPAEGATIHVAKYLSPVAESDPKSEARELEALLDLMQPGWRDVVVQQRFLPSMVVSHALVTAAAGGAAGRPGPAVPDIANLYVIGDWVGPDGLLADASLASAKRAAQLVTQTETARAAAAA